MTNHNFNFTQSNSPDLATELKQYQLEQLTLAKFLYASPSRVDLREQAAQLRASKTNPELEQLAQGLTELFQTLDAAQTYLTTKSDQSDPSEFNSTLATDLELVKAFIANLQSSKLKTLSMAKLEQALSKLAPLLAELKQLISADPTADAIQVANESPVEQESSLESATTAEPAASSNRLEQLVALVCEQLNEAAQLPKVNEPDLGLWHPYNKPTTNALKVDSAKGIYLETQYRTLIDGVSSWWSTAYGHRNPLLIQALQQQAQQLDHVMFAGLTHQPAQDLAQNLISLLGEKWNRVFFSDSGSVAVEVALKIAIRYQRSVLNHRRTHFIALKGGYHGDTLGAMQVSDSKELHYIYTKDNSNQTIFISPPPSLKQEDWDATKLSFKTELSAKEIDESAFITELKQALTQEDSENKIAGFICEPMLQGAAGFQLYDPRYLNRAIEICHSHHVVTIFDEIATGFGRTGRDFAHQYLSKRPDILTLGKALSGGVITLGATLVNDRITKALDADNSPPYGLSHGPTFMANPLACAVANASVDLFRNQYSMRGKYLKQQKEQLLAQQAVAVNSAEFTKLDAMIRQQQVNIYQEFFHQQIFAPTREKLLEISAQRDARFASIQQCYQQYMQANSRYLFTAERGYAIENQEGETVSRIILTPIKGVEVTDPPTAKMFGLAEEDFAKLRYRLAKSTPNYARIQDIRYLGNLFVVEFEKEMEIPPLYSRYLLEKGIWVRPFANILYLMLPYPQNLLELDDLATAVETLTSLFTDMLEAEIGAYLSFIETNTRNNNMAADKLYLKLAENNFFRIVKLPETEVNTADTEIAEHNLAAESLHQTNAEQEAETEQDFADNANSVHNYF